MSVSGVEITWLGRGVKTLSATLVIVVCKSWEIALSCWVVLWRVSCRSMDMSNELLSVSEDMDWTSVVSVIGFWGSEVGDGAVGG